MENAPPLVSTHRDRSFIAMSAMCCLFCATVVIIMLVLNGKIEAIGMEQYRRTVVMTELKAFREEVTALRGKVEERTIQLETMKGQQLTNVLQASILEKKIDTLTSRLNDLVYVQRPVERPPASGPKE